MMSEIIEKYGEALFSNAQKAAQTAYAPYSQFHVGAAVLSADYEIYMGCNVENAAYPEGLCAEASAIAQMVQQGKTTIKAIAVYANSQELTTPCGGCRQKIREFAAPKTPILICNDTGIIATMTLAELLPHSFGPDNLKR
jgi:cytidine deaminase